jgi:hypothetical protein
MHFIQALIPASRLHRYHSLKIPIVLAGKAQALPVGDGPQDGRIDGAAKVGMKFGTWGFGWLRHTRFYCRRPLFRPTPERGGDIVRNRLSLVFALKPRPRYLSVAHHPGETWRTGGSHDFWQRHGLGKSELVIRHQ